jgi:hypothetical protein
MINMSSATNATASMISRRGIAALMKRGLPLAGAQWAKVWVRNTNIAKYKGILLQLAEGEELGSNLLRVANSSQWDLVVDSNLAHRRVAASRTSRESIYGDQVYQWDTYKPTG